MPLTLALVVLAAAPTDPLLERAEQLRAAFTAQPSWPAELLSPDFKPDKHKRLFAEIASELGATKSITVVARKSPTAASLELRFEKGLVPVELSIDPKPPHSIVALWLSPTEPDLPDLGAATEAFSRLPGSTSFAACKLGGATPELIASHRPDETLAIGSAFKLYVAGALLKQINAGKRSWSEVVKLDPKLKSLPSGVLQTWPEGSPVTLHTLATMMLSRSDNTATDHLIATLGRPAIEGMLVPMGNGSAARNTPFLSTAQMFRLKEVDDGQAGTAYLATDAKGRAAFLTKELEQWPLSRAAPGSRGPRFVDSIEWFASAADLCRAMDFIRVQTEKPAGSLLRSSLAINPGSNAAGLFAYAGYKGGSEPGVLNLTWLLQTRRGAWWVVTVTSNDPGAPVDEATLSGLASRVLKLIARGDAKEG